MQKVGRQSLESLKSVEKKRGAQSLKSVEKKRQAVHRVLEVRREKKGHDDGRNGHRLWRFIGVFPTPMSIKIFTSPPPLNRGGKVRISYSRGS